MRLLKRVNELICVKSLEQCQRYNWNQLIKMIKKNILKCKANDSYSYTTKQLNLQCELSCKLWSKEKHDRLLPNESKAHRVLWSMTHTSHSFMHWEKKISDLSQTQTSVTHHTHTHTHHFSPCLSFILGLYLVVWKIINFMQVKFKTIIKTIVPYCVTWFSTVQYSII